MFGTGSLLFVGGILKMDDWITFKTSALTYVIDALNPPSSACAKKI